MTTADGRASLNLLGLRRPSLIAAAVFLPLLISSTQTDPVRPLRFERVTVDAEGPRDIWLKAVGDLNGDNRPDLVAGGNGGGGLVWYANPSWKRSVIAASGAFSTDAELVDMGLDGDLDLFAITNSELLWYENGADWAPHRVAKIELHDIELVDFDRDGYIDVAGRNQSAFEGQGNQVHLFYQQPEREWRHVTLPVPDGEGLVAFDIDQDGDLDLVLGQVWLENPGNTGAEWLTRRYSESWAHPHAFLAVADLNGDERPDIIAAPSEAAGQEYRISWFEAPDIPARGPWKEHVIDQTVEAVQHFAGAADFNKDGRTDVATAQMEQGKDPDEIRIYLNLGKGQKWEKVVIGTTGSHSMRVADVDGDGWPDLYGANWRGRAVELYKNVTARPQTDQGSNHPAEPPAK